MKMKNKVFFVPIVVLIILALGVRNSGQTTTPKQTTATPNSTTITQQTTITWTTGRPALNLNGKMFTLSLNRGGISFYPPYFSPHSPTPSYTTHRYTTTYPPWTTASPTSSVSVCLSYITDFLQASSLTIFTLSPSRSPLTLGVRQGTTYWLNCPYNSMYFAPSINFWPNIRSDIWTRVCVTVDGRKNVAQVFSGSNMSLRKVLPFQYVWSGEPVIDFSGFDGQITDVQVWDYSLRYGEVYNYMTRGVYKAYRGSVLSWSYISYSIRGNTLLEDTYERQEQSVSRRGRGRQLKGKVFQYKRMEKEKQHL